MQFPGLFYYQQILSSIHIILKRLKRKSPAVSITVAQDWTTNLLSQLKLNDFLYQNRNYTTALNNNNFHFIIYSLLSIVIL